MLPRLGLLFKCGYWSYSWHSKYKSCFLFYFQYFPVRSQHLSDHHGHRNLLRISEYVPLVSCNQEGELSPFTASCSVGRPVWKMASSQAHEEALVGQSVVCLRRSVQAKAWLAVSQAEKQDRIVVERWTYTVQVLQSWCSKHHFITGTVTGKELNPSFLCQSNVLSISKPQDSKS